MTTRGQPPPSAEDYRHLSQEELRQRIRDLEGRVGGPGEGGTGDGPTFPAGAEAMRAVCPELAEYLPHEVGPAPDPAGDADGGRPS